MSRVVGFACAAAAVCLSVPQASAREDASPLGVEVASNARGTHVITLSFTGGYALNARVPPERRLRLELGGRVWTTDAFASSAEGARVEVDATGARQGDLTVYLCRADRCTKVRRALTF